MASELTPIQPEGWKRARGYSYAMRAAGTRHVSIAGQVGRRPDQEEVPADADFATQWDQALANVVTVLHAAGGSPDQITAMRIYVTDLAAYHAAGKQNGEAWMRHIGKHFPASTLVQVTALLDPNAKVEIEAEAVLP